MACPKSHLDELSELILFSVRAFDLEKTLTTSPLHSLTVLFEFSRPPNDFSEGRIPTSKYDIVYFSILVSHFSFCPMISLTEAIF